MLRLLMLLTRLLVFLLLLLKEGSGGVFLGGEINGGGCREDAGLTVRV